MSVYFDKSAIVKNVTGPESAKIYKECRVENTKMAVNATIGDFSRVFHSSLAEWCAIQRNAMMYSTKMGRYSYTGKNFTSWNCEIGAFCSISWNVSVGGANHDYTRGTTHSMLYSHDFGMLEGEPLYDRFEDECMIGNDVWIAANACICRGVKVGDGAVIAAGAVVTHDVEPYAIVGGVPARVLKKRFSDEVIEILLQTKWWEFPEEIIKKNLSLIGSKMDLEVAKKLLSIRKELDLGEDIC